MQLLLLEGMSGQNLLAMLRNNRDRARFHSGVARQSWHRSRCQQNCCPNQQNMTFLNIVGILVSHLFSLSRRAGQEETRGLVRWELLKSL